MPVAEAVGLALGAVALASLFTTCVELFDLFETGQNHGNDFHLACIKLELLRVRLVSWGGLLHITEPGGEDLDLRAQWPWKSEVVFGCLWEIQRILGDSDVLANKYKLVERPVSVRKRAVWAIRDKDRFAALVQDISFLIENLEKVTKSTYPLVRMTTPSGYGMLRRGAGTHVIEERAFTGQGQVLGPITQGSTQMSQPEKSVVSQNAQNYQEQTTQTNIDSIGFQGPSGEQQGITVIRGVVQINQQKAVGFQGHTSTDCAAAVARAYYEAALKAGK